MVLGDLKRRGDTIDVYCVPTPSNPCSHAGTVDLGKAISIFGPDFEVASDRPRFVHALVCSVCGRRDPDIRWSMAGTQGYGLSRHPAAEGER